MRASTAGSRLLEDRFPHLVKKDEEGGGRSYRTAAGKEVFAIDPDGRKLRIPVERKLLDDLFGGVPFPVESAGEQSIVPLQDLNDPEILFALIEALEEQSGATMPGASDASPASRPARFGSGSPRSTRLMRLAFAALALLLVVFLAYSWNLARRGLDRDREQWIETLLRR